jgi:hypothetical protein
VSGVEIWRKSGIPDEVEGLGGRVGFFGGLGGAGVGVGVVAVEDFFLRRIEGIGVEFERFLVVN